MSRGWPSLELRYAVMPGDSRAAAEERAAAAIDDCQPTAIVEHPDRWLLSFSSPQLRDQAAARLADALGADARVEALELPDENWAARSQAALGPVRAGRIVVAPPWHAPSVDRGATPIVVIVEPSMGFGTGHHATTRMCLLALQAVPVEGRRVLDIGTGSGVLAMAAALLGAASVVALDDDPDAIDCARDNADRQGLLERIELRVNDFRESEEPPRDLVLANLTGALLAREAATIATTVGSGGHLVLSGFTVAERNQVVTAFAPAFRITWEREEDGWGCVVLASGGRS